MTFCLILCARLLSFMHCPNIMIIIDTRPNRHHTDVMKSSQALQQDITAIAICVCSNVCELWKRLTKTACVF